MKTKLFLAILASAALVSFAVSCEKENGSGGGDSDKKEEMKSKECKLLSISLKSGDMTIEGFVYEEDKVAEVTCMPAQKEALKKASAEVAVSEKATITPDPKEVRDYTVADGVKFKVTAEDGKTSQEYTVILKDAKIKTVCKKVWEKTFGDLGIKPNISEIGNVGFSGDKFVTNNLEVLDLEGKTVGKLCTDGIVDSKAADFCLTCVSNDHANHLVASVGYAAGGETFSKEIKYTRYYIWADGWDKAPKLLYENKEAEVAKYFSASGDLLKQGILTFIAGRSATQMHHCNVFVDGKINWNAFNTPYPGNDGNWGANVSAASGDPEGYFFICDSRGNNSGVDVYSRKGIKGNDVQLNGSLVDDGTVAGEHGGKNQYGNYSTGYVRAFTLNGKAYAAVVSSGWPSTYLTIQSADPAEEEHYLLRSQVWAAGSPKPCAAVYTVSGNEVYVLMSSPSSASMMALFKISTEVI